MANLAVMKTSPARKVQNRQTPSSSRHRRRRCFRSKKQSRAASQISTFRTTMRSSKPRRLEQSTKSDLVTAFWETLTQMKTSKINKTTKSPQNQRKTFLCHATCAEELTKVLILPLALTTLLTQNKRRRKSKYL